MPKAVFETVSVNPAFCFIKGASNEFCPLSKKHLMEFAPNSNGRTIRIIGGVFYHAHSVNNTK